MGLTSPRQRTLNESAGTAPPVPGGAARPNEKSIVLSIRSITAAVSIRSRKYCAFSPPRVARTRERLSPESTCKDRFEGVKIWLRQRVPPLSFADKRMYTKRERVRLRGNDEYLVLNFVGVVTSPGARALAGVRNSSRRSDRARDKKSRRCVERRSRCCKCCLQAKGVPRRKHRRVICGVTKLVAQLQGKAERRLMRVYARTVATRERRVSSRGWALCNPHAKGLPSSVIC